MKRISFLLAILLVLIIPGVFFQHVEKDRAPRNPIMETIAQPTSEFLIRVKDDGCVNLMDLEDYVIGVVLGEMPASFETEALKAQAVATRTYTLRKILKQNKHEDADICADASCCQAYLSADEYLGARGSAADFQKIKSAVQDTEMQVLCYEGALIEATYFSCSGGMTEDAVAVWGADVPYLESVPSPGENHAKHYETEASFTKEELLRKLGLSTESFGADDISFTYTSGDGVKEMEILGVVYTGTQVRTLLDLPSTAFSVTFDGNRVIVRSKGYGHRVGMSQYGADAMAMNGSTYDEILLHYYKGTSLKSLTEKEAKAIFDKEENL